MNPFRAVASTAGCLEKAVGWGAGLVFAVVGLRLLAISPTQDPAWAAAGMAVACLLTSVLIVRSLALGRPGRAVGILWFLYLAGYLLAVALFLPR